MAISEARYYILKIYLPGTKIYRTCRAPGHVTLKELHCAIHEWMEFPTEEMYGFFLNNKLLSEDGYYAPQMRKKLSAADVKLDMLNLRKDQRFLYVYDMTEMFQFYIHVDDILPADRMSPEYVDICLLRQNGTLKKETADEAEAASDADAYLNAQMYHARGEKISMAACIRSNDMDQMLWTAECMNARAVRDKDELSETMASMLIQDETLMVRMMPEYMIRTLTDIWSQSDVTASEESLKFLSLLGFLTVRDSEILWSIEARDWFTTVMSRYEMRQLRSEYAEWHLYCRGLLISYGVIRMDDFLMFFRRHVERQAQAQDVCDFVMQRMEWYMECYAIEIGAKMYFSMPDEKRATRILRERAQYPLPYKRLTKRQIQENAETAGWEHVDCGQELFDALQGIAVPELDLNEVLNDIVEAFVRGLEPHEVIREVLPPETLIGRAAYRKIHYCLGRVRRQLPDYALMGYTIEEIEKRDPEYKTQEGFTIIRGGSRP